MGQSEVNSWAVEAYPVIIFLVLLDKRLEHFGCVVGGILSALASEMLEGRLQFRVVT